MASEFLGAALPALGGATASPAGYKFSLTDLSHFDAAMSRAQHAQSAGGAGGQGGAAPSGAQAAHGVGPSQAPSAIEASSPALESMMQPFEHISTEAAELSRRADAAAASGHTMTPGEMIMLTVRCQEFMFHCQLTSNVANRTSDGLQQLFRQQS